MTFFHGCLYLYETVWLPSGQLDKTEVSRDNSRHCLWKVVVHLLLFIFCSSSILALGNAVPGTLEHEEQRKILGYFSLHSEDHACRETLVELYNMSVLNHLLLDFTPKTTKIYVVKLLFSDTELNWMLNNWQLSLGSAHTLFWELLSLTTQMNDFKLFLEKS